MSLDKYIFWGAGKKGTGALRFMRYKGFDDCIMAFCDKKYKQISDVGGVPVISPEEAISSPYPIVITIAGLSHDAPLIRTLKSLSKPYFDDFLTFVSQTFGGNKVELDREFCAYFHISDMDGYFERAESGADIFWRPDGDFFPLFEKLDLDNVIELAAGRGRHVPHYIDKAQHVTLVDVDQKNIDLCKNRLQDFDGKITYYTNNGYDLHELASQRYTGLFTYDSMVHFELMDIFSYLRETFRVLKSGSYALFHHSNNADYKATFATGVHSRNFMTKETFAYLADRAGLIIVEQKVIDWSEKGNQLDCITLLRKP